MTLADRIHPELTDAEYHAHWRYEATRAAGKASSGLCIQPTCTGRLTCGDDECIDYVVDELPTPFWHHFNALMAHRIDQIDQEEEQASVLAGLVLLVACGTLGGALVAVAMAVGVWHGWLGLWVRL